MARALGGAPGASTRVCTDGGRVAVIPHADGGYRFPFRFAKAYAIAALPFGVTPATTGVVVTTEKLDVRFGPWRLSTPLSNVVSVSAAGPYRFHRTAGPAHLSLSDLGVTFATNGNRGVCIELGRPVRSLNPFGPPLHPNVTVTVADVDELVAVLDAR